MIIPLMMVLGSGCAGIVIKSNNLANLVPVGTNQMETNYKCARARANNEADPNKLLEIDTYGILRTLNYKIELYESGKVKSITIGTQSTSKDLFWGLNEILDTAATTIQKSKPL